MNLLLRYILGSKTDRDNVKRGRRIQKHLNKRRNEILKGNTGTKDPVVVFHMGKVGSSTLAHSIRINSKCKSSPDQLTNLNIPYHIHFMSKSGVFKTNKPKKGDYYFLRAPHLQVGWSLHKIFVHSKQKMNFIIPVRDVVARNLSTFFQIADGNPARIKEWLGKDIILYKPEELAMVISRYIEQHSSFPVEWFHREIETVLGLKVFEHTFEKKRGYTYIQGENYNVLLLKIELADETIGQAVGDFIGVKPFPIHRWNITKEKGYGQLYQEVKTRICLSPETLDKCYNTRYMKNFYTVSEIAGFRSRWGGAVKCSA